MPTKKKLRSTKKLGRYVPSLPEYEKDMSKYFTPENQAIAEKDLAKLEKKPLRKIKRVVQKRSTTRTVKKIK
jgi:hypothetical protein